MPTIPAARPDVHSYADYRAFLQDFYAWKKNNTKRFSLRSLKVRKHPDDLKGRGKNNPYYSAQFLHLVITGQKPMSERMAAAVAEAFELSDSETLFLQRLVRFHLSEDPDTRLETFRRMAWRQEFREAQGIGSRERLDFISHGFIGDVYLMTARADFRADARWISDRMMFPVTRSQVRTALAVLEDLDLISVAADGTVTRTAADSPMPETGEAMLFRIYHMEQAEKARHALEQLPTDDRLFNTWGVSRFTEGDFRAWKSELATRIDEVVAEVTEKWADRSADGDIVAQINFQLFPLTHIDNSDDEQDDR